MTASKFPKAAQAFCNWCNTAFVPTSNQHHRIALGSPVFCSPQCGCAASNSRANHTCGPCPTCGRLFPSRLKDKKYCSMDCYTSSGELQTRLRDHNNRVHAEAVARRAADPPKMIRNQRRPVSCPQCGTVFVTLKKKYCSDVCRRAYFSARFDRFIANPERVALPQCYDEFLDSEILSCPVDGCDWTGKQLGNHVNFAHGITADAFRELCGFNAKTGLVSKDVKQVMVDNTRRRIDSGELVPRFTTDDGGDRQVRTNNRAVSLEAREHAKKARAIMCANYTPSRSIPCLECGLSIPQPPQGRRLYCDTVCRSKFYRRKNKAELKCSFCGEEFWADANQVRASRRGSRICCSLKCRNKMNIRAALAFRGLDLKHLPDLTDYVAEKRALNDQALQSLSR